MLLSPDAVAQQVDVAIQSSPYLVGRRLRFEMKDGHVVLQGCVGSYFQKQMAQEAVRRIDGVERIENQLEVLWPGDPLFSSAS
ncbi:MAG: BON domain-containing protein [Planctomycetes bacterium]|nr:BON domain-containing protein [Planctomycetota bacterium]